jgi:hypothetical protein
MSVPSEHMVASPIKPTPEEKLEKVLKTFEDANKTSTDNPGKNLRDLLDKSPDLKKRITDAVDQGHLTAFVALPSGSGTGGSYNSGTKAISLPIDHLNKSATSAASAGELVFVMGHEIQHAFNSKESNKALSAFATEATRIAGTKSPHDYTAAVATITDNYRKDEASAHIGGFNAISSQVMKDNPKATLKDLYNAQPGRMEDFIDRTGTSPKFSYALKPGLTIDANNKMPESADNIKAMGKYYFDQPPSSARLGPSGNLDYPHFMANQFLNIIDKFEKTALTEKQKTDKTATAPEVQLDLKKLGLDSRLLSTTLPYKDITPAPPSIKSPIDAPSTETIGKASTSASTPDSPITSGNKAPPALYTQAMAALEKVGPESGIKGEELRNVAAAMAVQADKTGMTEISGAVKGSNGNIIAFQGDPSTDQAKRTVVDVDTAKLQPAAKTLEEMGQGAKAVAMEAPQPQRSQVM